MVDVAVSTTLQQWAFEKPSLDRPQRSDSPSSSPDLSRPDAETLRIDTAQANAVVAVEKMLPSDSTSLHERYLSSEEDLSPMDGNSSDSEYDSDVSIHSVKEVFQARKMSISKWDKGKSCDLAVTVSYVVAGRPKMIELATSPIRQTRPVSFHQPPLTAPVEKSRKHVRHTLMVSASTSRSTSPAISFQSRRPSIGHSPYSHSNKSVVQLSDSASSYTSDGSIRSSSPVMSDKSAAAMRPAATSTLSRRSSLYLVSSANRATAPFPPFTPLSPEPHSFLSSDPYENSTSNAASPIIKSPPHKRLRSISQKLSLAKIAITPSTKKWDSRINGKAGNMPTTPSTPYSPMTPQTAPATTGTSPLKKLRRNSRMLSRPPTRHSVSPEMPPVPVVPSPPRKASTTHKMVARGADEREPMIELPPFPDDDAAMHNSIKSRKIRKRKSLMDLL